MGLTQSEWQQTKEKGGEDSKVVGPAVDDAALTVGGPRMRAVVAWSRGGHTGFSQCGSFRRIVPHLSHPVSGIRKRK